MNLRQKSIAAIRRLPKSASLKDIASQLLTIDDIESPLHPLECLSEPALNALINHPHRIFIKDTSRRFEFANVACCAAAKLATLTGLRDEDLFSSPHRDRAIADDDRIFCETTAIIEKDEIETWADGSITFVHTTKLPLLETENGTVVGLLGISRQLTVIERENLLRKMTGTATVSDDTDIGFYYQVIGSDERWIDNKFSTFFPEQSLLRRIKRIHVNDRQHVRHFLKAATNPHISFQSSVDFRCYDLDQNLVWIRGNAYRCTWNSKPALFVTHRRIDQPRVGDYLAHQLMESFPGFVFVKDAQFRFKYMNASLLRALGKSLDQVLNRTDEEIGLLPGEIDVFRRGDESVLFGQPAMPHVSLNESLTLPTRSLSNEEQKVQLVTIKFPIPAVAFEPGYEESGANHVLGVAIEITEFWRNLREAALLWEALLKNSPDAIYVKDCDRRYLAVSDAFCRVCGLPPNKILGKAAAEVWKENNSEAVARMNEEDEAVLSGRGPIHCTARRTRLPDGSTQLRSTCKVLVPDDEARAWRILGLSQDVTWIAMTRYVDPHLLRMASNPPPPKKQIVTVLFSDIRGFSQLALDFDSNLEVVVDLLTRFFDLSVKLGSVHRCIIDKFLGDGAMVLAGALGDQSETPALCAERVARFAMQLHRDFKTVVEDWRNHNRHLIVRHREIVLGTGIHSGTAVAGFIKTSHRIEFSAFGDSVNVAQRLESMAGREHGQILVSPAVARLLEKDYELGPELKLRPPKETSEFYAFELRSARDVKLPGFE